MKLIRGMLLALIASLIAGLLLGAIFRMRMEGEPVRYFVEYRGSSGPRLAHLGSARVPGNVRDSGSLVLGASHHEEQIG